MPYGRAGPPAVLHALGHIEQIVRCLPQVFPYFAGRPWVLIEFKRRSSRATRL